MKRAASIALLAIATGPLFAGTPPTKPVLKKVSSAKPSTTHTSKANHPATRATTSRGTTQLARRTRAVRSAPVPTYQLHPDPDRYVEIQKALADRGYFKGEPNGTWSDDSVDAVRRFQADQKLDDTGKIDSLTLISLGLGPRHDGTTARLMGDPAATPIPPTSASEPPPASPSTHQRD